MEPLSSSRQYFNREYSLQNYRLPPKIVSNVLRWSIEHLKKLPNINKATTALSKQITVCGDLHGKFDDLLVILYKVISILVHFG